MDYLWNCQVLHGSLGKGCGIYGKLLNFSEMLLCYNHSDSTVIPEILSFLKIVKFLKVPCVGYRYSTVSNNHRYMV